MLTRRVLLIVLTSAAATLLDYSAASANSQNIPQGPSEVARALVDQGVVVQVPVKGKVKPSISKEAATFELPSGRSSVVLLRLPDYQSPYGITIVSFRRGIGRTTEMFIPSSVSLGAEFQQLGDFGEDRLVGKVESVMAQIPIDETSRDARYLLVYTRGDLVGQRVGMRAVINGVSVPGRAGTFIGSGFGLGRVERSLEAKLEVETKPTTKKK